MLNSLAPRASLAPATLARAGAGARPGSGRPGVWGKRGGRARGGLGDPIAAGGGWLGGLFGGGGAELALEDSDPDFRAWLAHRGLPEKQKLVAQTCGDEGRGLVATAQIHKQEAMLRVPRDLLIDADVAAAESSIGQELVAAGVPAWTILAAFLVEARYKEVTQGQAYSWAPYMRQLPSSTGSILEWNTAEVESLLAGMSALAAAREIRSAAAASWREAAPVVTAAEEAGTLQADVVTQAAMEWAFGILLSRLIRLPGLGNREALVPWADFLNHSSATSAHLDYDTGMQAVVLRPDHPCAAGEQLYVSYGERSSTELLLSYGFVPNAGTNPYDSYIMQMALDKKDPLFGRKAAVLAEYGLSPAENFPLRMVAVPAALVPYQALIMEQKISCEAELFQLAGHFFERPEREATRVEAAYNVLLKRVKVCLAELDRAPAPPASADPTRAAQAAVLRKQEQRVLQRCDFFLREQLRGLRRAVHGA